MPRALMRRPEGRPGRSVNRSVLVWFFGLRHKFGSLQIGTDRFFTNLGTEQNRFRLVRFGSGSDRTNRGFTQAAKNRIEKIGKKILKKAQCRDFKKCEGVRGCHPPFISRVKLVLGLGCKVYWACLRISVPSVISVNRA